jgi:hypothetical protein
MFDLDETIPHFQVINRKYYLGELLQNATTTELLQFKKKVEVHQKNSKFIQDIYRMSVHDTIIKAINFELRKRSKLYPIYKSILPIRIKLVSWFSGVDLQEHTYCGPLYVKRQQRKTIFHITMSELASALKKFWLGHYKFLIKTSLAIIGLIIAAIGLYLKITE